LENHTCIKRPILSPILLVFFNEKTLNTGASGLQQNINADQLYIKKEKPIASHYTIRFLDII